MERKINREELAWAAGLFDGEGSTGCYHHKTGVRAISLTVGQGNRQVLDRFQRAVLELGKINGPYIRGHKNDYHIFRAQSFEEVQAIFAMLFNFLSPIKQAQGLKALKEYHG